MKIFLTTAAIVAALTMPAFAQMAGNDSSGDALGSVKSSTSRQDNKGPNAGTSTSTSTSTSTGAQVAPAPSARSGGGSGTSKGSTTNELDMGIK